MFSFQSPHFNLSRMKGICFPAERQHFENRPTTYCCQCAVEHEKPRVCGLLCGGVACGHLDISIFLYFYLFVGGRLRVHGGTEPRAAALEAGAGAVHLDLQVVTCRRPGLLGETEASLPLYLSHHVAEHRPVVVSDRHLVTSLQAALTGDTYIKIIRNFSLRPLEPGFVKVSSTVYNPGEDTQQGHH